MRPVHPVAAIRAAEAAAISVVGEGVLIDRASTAVARRCTAMLGSTYGSHVVILAGKGHNGADALWAGWKIAQRGARVDVALADQPADEHGAAPLRLLRRAGAREIAVGDVADADLLIDGLLGVGASGAPRDACAALVAAAAAHSLVVAVDVPSGVDADTGAVVGAAITAAATVTFGALKPGLVAGPGAERAGIVEVAEIGLVLPPGDCGITDADDVRAVLTQPSGEMTKYTRGAVAVVAGSARYPGAATLACTAALRAGAGMVWLFAPEDVVAEVRASRPEVVGRSRDELPDDRADAYVIGPGLGTDDAARDLVAKLLATNTPVLLDADALTVLAGDAGAVRRDAPTVLTPHTGEFERLTGKTRDDVAADRIGVTRAAADGLGATLLLKGLQTVIAGRDGVRVNPTGTPWLATAGTGDVLSGAIGAYLAAGCAALEAAAAASFLHGLAARLASAGAPVAAADVAEHWPDAVRLLVD